MHPVDKLGRKIHPKQANQHRINMYRGRFARIRGEITQLTSELNNWYRELASMPRNVDRPSDGALAHLASARHFAQLMDFHLQEFMDHAAKVRLGLKTRYEIESERRQRYEEAERKMEADLRKKQQEFREGVELSALFSLCSCPSGDGSLRYPCLLHPPETPKENSK